ncbi:hypothetical protein [Kitasatospora griseola]|uniref:hypothetical protein n=1 Tax=Kitasatospora griseola TaxID=2064 RepID=UPI00166FE9A1|nr:hypothetical protein [Kitasatospora griseola]
MSWPPCWWSAAPSPLPCGRSPLLHPWNRATVMGGNPAGRSPGDEAWFHLLFPLLLRLRPGLRTPSRHL